MKKGYLYYDKETDWFSWSSFFFYDRSNQGGISIDRS